MMLFVLGAMCFGVSDPLDIAEKGMYGPPNTPHETSNHDTISISAIVHMLNSMNAGTVHQFAVILKKLSQIEEKTEESQLNLIVKANMATRDVLAEIEKEEQAKCFNRSRRLCMVLCMVTINTVAVIAGLAGIFKAYYEYRSIAGTASNQKEMFEMLLDLKQQTQQLLEQCYNVTV